MKREGIMSSPEFSFDLVSQRPERRRLWALGPLWEMLRILLVLG